MNKISNTLIIPDGSCENFISFGHFGETELYRRVPVCGGISRIMKSGYEVKFYKHSAAELFYVTGGTMYFICNGEKITVKKGNCFFLPSNLDLHEYGNDSKHDISTLWFHFRPDMPNFPQKIKLPQKSFCRHASYLKEVSLLAELLYHQERTGDISGSDTAVMLKKYLFKEFDCNNSANEKNANEQLQKVFECVKNNLKKKWTVKELAKMACLSESHFFAITNRIYGDTPYNIVRKIKMEKAVSMLIRSNAKIENIATECGYSNAFAFSKAFRHVYRQSPGSIRTSASCRISAAKQK